MTDNTHFGFEKVSWAEKTDRVQDVFRRISSKYDLMNDLMSLGIHRLWKNYLVGNLDLTPNPVILDCAGGTGDISFRLVKTWPHLNPRIIVCDLTAAMIETGRDRAINQGIINPVQWVCGNAQNLPVNDCCVDLYIIAYGLRNVSRIDLALRDAYRVLKPGGKFVCLEFSHPSSSLLQKVYGFYSINFLPFLGKWVARDKAAYEYLVQSIQQFPDQETLSQQMKDSGFSSPQWENLWGGISCIHTGVKDIV
jgi:demethylmenaquinone methyltransferase/2-methoxy-6-polyprenyl-1,4-benzoquinol methylase